MLKNSLLFLTGFIFGRYLHKNNNNDDLALVSTVLETNDSNKETEKDISYKELRSFAKSLQIHNFHKMKYKELYAKVFHNT